MKPLVIIADDLSGAAESAAGFLLRSSGISLRLGPGEPDESGVTVFDLHSRRSDLTQASRDVRSVLQSSAGSEIVKKIDSLLRGNVAAEVAELSRDGSPVIVAAGLPRQGRTVRGGVVFVEGVELHATDLWRAELMPPPRSIAEALGPSAITSGVSLADIRSGRLGQVLSSTSEGGSVVICDVETEGDLDLIVAAAQQIPQARLVGTSALAAAVARRRTVQSTIVRPSLRDSRCTLVVVGTAEESAGDQVALLRDGGACHIEVNSAELLAHSVDPTSILNGLEHGSVVVSLSGPVVPSDSVHLASALAELIGAVDAGFTGNEHPIDLVLTGGETARSVLDRLRIDNLSPVHEIEHGAVLSVDHTGRYIVTRPGSFGDVHSLCSITEFLAHPTSVAAPDSPPSVKPSDNEVKPMSIESTPLPLIAVTMGDGAGVGPEVIVPALLDDETRKRCRPVVVGDAKRLRLAAEVLGIDVDVVDVEEIKDAEFIDGRINVIDLDLLPEDLAWGELSAVAGDAAYQYIRVASELAVRGEVHSICTAPLNKEALHAAGHIFPGHTELLAHLTGTEEVSMMLSTPKLKVIHVTTHIGLLDAVARIEPGLVERTIRRGHEALVRTGNPSPKIGVCGINPHAGENGLFGYGEEEQKIIPAVELLKAEGIDVHGPLPADTAFFLAGRGDYDLIVAMYHDQGHGPVKVLGIEAGVNITVGLPVIRTSVDHGTAFDIAGKGIAEAGSMVEALRQAAELATSTFVSK
ncbi:4-hydroxythreonine-4-phosphate dehydrogenase PdxA [Rhodococcus erythropolis]|uniref:4-hydroxythreonine-4-phosphate dehydrogenase PdxA n=1 Tax=Rhodococcus erythropolis TaxID=1833 RepID=UPI001E63061A|nr:MULTISPECIES: 4-hydroxythreonine-4-phosphate dehydrogenase PdxA [Rhodococcus erythropolis group]MCD2109429.1 4-hydroxythreonine-4-phosphate dehydrogenase PdxA [Rhodococcus qingshengii]MCZ4528356.1 4-hydroxythreonine-4-phosphate dehydrogenase PdxA [Rhodococcus erythropolis]